LIFFLAQLPQWVREGRDVDYMDEERGLWFKATIQKITSLQVSNVTDDIIKLVYASFQKAETYRWSEGKENIHVTYSTVIASCYACVHLPSNVHTLCYVLVVNMCARCRHDANTLRAFIMAISPYNPPIIGCVSHKHPIQ
jgi:hypothetical protein